MQRISQNGLSSNIPAGRVNNFLKGCPDVRRLQDIHLQQQPHFDHLKQHYFLCEDATPGSSIQREPMEKFHDNRSGIEVRSTGIVTVGFSAWPGMSQPVNPVMGHSTQLLTTTILVFLDVSGVQKRRLVMKTVSVTLRPLPDKVRHSRKTGTPSGAASIRNGLVGTSVELEDGDRCAARIAFNGDSDRIAAILAVALVVRARNGGKGSEARGGNGVAS